MSTQVAHPFKPILFKDTKILILGSFPSIKSFENNFYYSHPQNQFWKILSLITGYPTLIKDQKMWVLKETHLGLWDMIQSCQRENSLDIQLHNEEVNDIPSLLEAYPSIHTIAFTGRKSQELFESNFGYLEIKRVYLPSPSSAYAKMNIQNKALLYKENLLL